MREAGIGISNESFKVDGGAQWDPDHKLEVGVTVFKLSGVEPEEGELVRGSLKNGMVQGWVRVRAWNGARVTVLGSMLGLG